ncbi:COG4315 family predicted lipoprotein [Streptosporangium sp. H16]|uniref:COG4315 family predicted lipoprotein n=1 Tax=Streptosporangium sp. H16 TaxID=3444184 RepID=UPI003F7A81A9
MRKLLHAGVLALGVLAAGCGGADDGSTTEPMVADQVKASPTSPETPASSSPATRAKVELGETSIGKVLVGEGGRTLYLFEKDKDGKSSCSDACARAWPPYVTDGKPEAGQGVKEDLLDTTERDDGTTQVTYNRHPLYYFAKDTKAGDVKGHDVDGFGDEWYAVDADGKKARD